jgi:RNA polymerase sigma-70 factor (ECF subfamily)
LDERIQSATDEEIASAIAVDPRDDLCAELFRRYEKRVYFWCFSHAHDADEAVDLAQEILAKIFRGIGSFAGRSRFSTWAYQVTRNHCLGALSKRREQWRRRLHSIEGEIAEPLDPAHYERIDDERDCDRLLEAARDVMDMEEIEAFVLHYHEGLTVKEITKMLGCRNTTGARTLIQNARRKFARLVREKGFGDER